MEYYTKNTLKELGANLISFSPKEHEIIDEFNTQLAEAHSANHKNLVILSSYEDYIDAGFSPYLTFKEY